MSKNIFLLNSPELPTPGTHRFTTEKFMKGFLDHGYEIYIANKLDDIIDGSIVLVSNHGVDHPIINSDIGFNALSYLAEKYPNSIYLCWYYHGHYSKIPFKNFVITGEHFRMKPSLENHIFFWDLQQKINNYVPLTFSCSLFPEEIGTLVRNEKIDGCFIGTRYKYDWVVGLPNITYLAGLNHGQKIEESDRINIFLSSKIAFGFHSEGNISNNVVVERVFEGMAFGCVVISDCPAAGIITDGIVQVATNKEQFLEIYHRLLNDHDERIKLQQRGYEWVKTHGLYTHVAKNFLDKFRTLGFL